MLCFDLIDVNYTNALGMNEVFSGVGCALFKFGVCLPLELRLLNVLSACGGQGSWLFISRELGKLAHFGNASN